MSARVRQEGTWTSRFRDWLFSRGPVANERWEWRQLEALEDSVIQAAREGKKQTVMDRVVAPASSGNTERWWLVLLKLPIRVVAAVAGLLWTVVTGTVRLVIGLLRLLGELGPTLREIWRGREVDPKGSEVPRFPAWRRAKDSPDRIGLALSGGGIRSATFNLGMLQKLDELELLPGFDYLATVSGGGYIGAFWSAWLQRPERRKDGSLFPRGKGEEPEPGAIRHLREFSNFLRPRMALFSFSTGRIAAGLVSAIVPSVVVALLVLALSMGLWVATAGLLLSDQLTFSWGTVPVTARTSALWIVLVTLTIHFVFELMWFARPEENQARARAAYWLWAMVSTTVAALVWWLAWHFTPLPYSFLFRPLGAGATGQAQILLALFPIVAWGAALAFLVSTRVLFSRKGVTDFAAQARQAAHGRAISRVIFCLVLWTAGAVVWIGGQWLAAIGIGGVIAAVSTAITGGGSFAWLRGALSTQPNKPAGEGFLSRLKPLLPKLLATVTLAAAAASMASVIILIYQAAGHSGPITFFLVAALLAAIVCLVFEPQENGFHSLYRARLARAYLGASNEAPPLPFATEVRRNDDVSMDRLSDRPLHLVCCTANDLAADGLRTLHRGAESAVLSKFGLQVGDVWRPWRTYLGQDVRVPTLSHAITASAAAFNSHMGSVSMRIGRAATFLITALGLRLGLWVEGPVGRSESYRRSWTALQRNFPGLLFFRELLGFSRSRAGWVHLSDGAHFENLALYELVRRHCRYILLSDCGADPDVAFDDFGNAVRRVREDFDVEIRIDLTALRPESGSSRQPVVAGDIVYPGGDKGILLYVKPTLTGNEPQDVTQYARRNREFPHETTLDQFYDEAQWEAYRRLGAHVIAEALETLAVAEPKSARPWSRLVRFFLEARFAWPPSRSDDGAVLSRLDADWAALERKVASGHSILRDDLYPGLSPKSPTPIGEQLSECLPHVLEALQITSSVVLESGINDTATAASHPRYQGWLNRFGRWASTDAFRALWPWLSPNLNRSVVEFMGREGRLPTSKDHPKARVQRVHSKSPVPACLDPWLLVSERPTRADETWGFFDPLGPGGADTLVATARIRIAGRQAILRPERFQVAPGLWSIGIGESFLDRLVEELELRGAIDEILVRPEREGGFDFSATMSALFVGGGFERVPDEAGGGFARAVQPSPKAP